MGSKYHSFPHFLTRQWLKGTLNSSTNNKNIIDETDEVFYFPEDALLVGQDNVITIVLVSLTLFLVLTPRRALFSNTFRQDNMGLEEAEGGMSDSVVSQT